MEEKFNVYVLFLLSLLIASCTSSPDRGEEYNRIVGITLDSLNEAIDGASTVSVNNVLSKSQSLGEDQISVEVNMSSASVISLDGEKYLARAYSIKEKNLISISIDSYIIPVKNQPDYLFFPTITAFDTMKNPIEQLEPEPGYSIFGVLSTKFKIPDNTAFVLIHTDMKYLQLGSIDGSDGGLTPNKNYNDTQIGGAVAGILGGAIGGAIYATITKPSRDSSLPAENYFFGPGGVMDIKIEEK
jgi:hypothetical protein